MLTVACVYWKGKFRGREDVYTTKWVERLKTMVAYNLQVPHRFVCLSNVEVPCERIPLKHNWPGWWSKIELFRPGLFGDRVLYLDLDLIVLKDLKPFFERPSRFTILGKDKRFTINGKDGMEIVRFNSSVMAFDPRVVDSLYTGFIPEIMKTYRGDQDYIASEYPGLQTFPKGWVEKLRYCPGGEPTEGLKIMLCMPGKNEKAAKKHPWIKEVWK